MRNQLVMGCVALVVAAGARVATADATADRLAALDKAAKCNDPASVWRTWCPATKVASGTADALPKGKVLVGLALGLEKDKETWDLTNHVSLAALSISAYGKARLTAITGSSDAENQMIGVAVGEVSALLKGTSTVAKLPAELAAYVKSRPADHDVKKVDAHWTWESDAFHTQLVKVGDVWVTVESDKTSAVIVTVLTEAWQ